MPDLLVAVKNDRDLLWRLHEMQGTATISHESRDAGGLAGLTRGIGHLACEHLVIVLFHHVPGPLLEIGVGQVRDAVGWLLAGAVRNERVGRILVIGTWRTRHRDKVPPDTSSPGRAVGGKIRNRTAGRLRIRKANHTD